MKTKNIRKHLNNFNKWRRGAEIEMPDPKFIWEVIDLAIDKLLTQQNRIKDLKEQIKNDDDYFETAIWEIKFNSLQKQHYLSLLEEVEILLDKNINPNLIKKVIKNWKERAILDESIHYDELNCDFT